MAGDWIKMRIDLMEDPAVMQMAEKLNVREETVVGYCHAFWSWVSRQCHDGSVTGVTLVSLGRRLNLPGFPEMLVKVGWLDYDDSGDHPVIGIPKFERHLSQGAKARGLAAIRKKNARDVSVPKMSRSARDINVTREEKRRVINPPSPPSEKGGGRRKRKEPRDVPMLTHEELVAARVANGQSTEGSDAG